jgi:hypothetical protein
MRETTASTKANKGVSLGMWTMHTCENERNAG